MMTDYESIALEKIGHHFRHQLGSLIGDCLAQMPKSLESEVLTHLNTKCDVYKAPYDKHLEVKRANWGNEKEAVLSYKGSPLDFTAPSEDTVCLAEVPDFLAL